MLEGRERKFKANYPTDELKNRKAKIYNRRARTQYS
jgi:hypothetical protein